MSIITRPIGPEARIIQERNDSLPSPATASSAMPASWAQATSGDVSPSRTTKARAATQRRQVVDIERGSPRPSRTGLPLAFEPRPESSRLDPSLADRAKSDNSANPWGKVQAEDGAGGCLERFT